MVNFSRFRRFWVDKNVGADWTLFGKSVSGLKVINVGILIFDCEDVQLGIFRGREIRTSK